MTVSIEPALSTAAASAAPVNYEDISDIVADKSPDSEDLAQFLDACVAQLVSDKHAWESAALERISDCASFMPRPGGHLDKKYGTAHVLARKLSTDLGDPDDPKVRTWGLIIYKQLLAKLSSVTRERQRRLDAVRLQPKKVYRTMCLMKNKTAPVSKDVIDPVPMPVLEAPLEELAPVIAALAAGGPEFTADEEMVEFKRGVIFADGRLDLCKQVVGPSHIGKVMDALKDNGHISHFLLGNNITGMKGAEAVSKFIAEKHQPVVETWYLAGNEIDAEGVELLAKSLATDTDVKSLWLKRNPIRTAGALSMSNMLRVNTTLKVLDLLNTGILDDGAKTLFDSMHEAKSLRSLYLDANGLTATSAPSIASYFSTLVKEKRKGLTRFWVGMNRLGDEGAQLILRALSGYPFIRTLSLNSNRLTSASAKEAYDAFATHGKLRVLDLGMYKATVDMGEHPNNLSDEGAVWMAELITRNNTIEILDLCENDISDDGMMNIVTALEGNSSILSLSFGQNGKRYPKDVLNRASSHVRRNLTSHGLLATGPELKQFLRHIIHGKRVDHIDSIYRNRAMKGQ